MDAGPVLLSELPQPNHQGLVAGHGKPGDHGRLHQAELLCNRPGEVDSRLVQAVCGGLDVVSEPVAVHADLAHEGPLSPLLRNVAERLRGLSVDGGHVVGGGGAAGQGHLHAGFVHAAGVGRVREPGFGREGVILEPFQQRQIESQP